jgi:uncharacterized membrane protein YkgB
MSTDTSLLVIGMSIMTVIITIALWHQFWENQTIKNLTAHDKPFISFSDQQLQEIQQLLDQGQYEEASQQIQAWSIELHQQQDNENLALLSSLLNRLHNEHNVQA